jgi:hypothetical protein
LHTSKIIFISEVLALIAGINKTYAAGTKVTIAGVQYTAAQLTSALQALVTLMTDVQTAEAAYKAKLAVEAAQAPPMLALVQATKGYVRATVGDANDVLSDFGMVPRKTPAPLTAAEKAAASLKRAATRKARNTMGSQQKKLITGATVPAVTPTAAQAVPAGSGVIPGGVLPLTSK